MRAQTQMVAELRADNTALRREVATLRGELSAQYNELAELRRTVQELLAAGGAGEGRHRAVAGPADAHGQSGTPVGAATPACPPSPPPQPLLSAPAVTRAAAPPPSPATPIAPPGDGRACAHTYARDERRMHVPALTCDAIMLRLFASLRCARWHLCAPSRCPLSPRLWPQ